MAKEHKLDVFWVGFFSAEPSDTADVHETKSEAEDQGYDYIVEIQVPKTGAKYRTIKLD